MVVRFLVGWFFDIVSQMKGHVGGGSGSWRLSGAKGSVKFKPFLYVSIYIHLFIYCAGMAPGNERFLLGLFRLAGTGHQT